MAALTLPPGAVGVSPPFPLIEHDPGAARENHRDGEMEMGTEHFFAFNFN
ncbi:MAG: hypothetical protein ACE5JX_04965 [Acidobacteriota bacterium]